MLPDDTSDPIDRFTRGIIRRKARQLIGRAGFTPDDYEDLVQQFLLKLLESLDKYDPARGHRNQFITAVVERYTASLLRYRRARCRDYRRLRSLRTLVPAGDGQRVERAETLSQAAHHIRLGQPARSDQERVDLGRDLADVLAGLPEEERDLAVRLLTQPLAQIAREQGVPRSTLCRVRRRLRRHFEKAELQGYL